MCRHLSFGSGRFEGTEYGDAFDNVEEKPGEWVSHIPTKVWHPFCTWELGRLTIGMDANEERTSHYDLAYAYLFEEKKSDSENSAEQKQIEDGVNESFLVCDINEFDYKRIYPDFPDRDYIRKNYSYKCKNSKSGESKNISLIPSVTFHQYECGIIRVLLSKNKNIYFTRYIIDKYGDTIESIDKTIKYTNGYINEVKANYNNENYWTILKKNEDLWISNGNVGQKNLEFKITTRLTPDQLTYLASEDVWELPDFLKQ
jgi:signal peptidase I